MTAAVLPQHDPAVVLAGNSVEELIRRAHVLLADWRIKVGYTFEAYLANAVCVGQAIATGALDANRRRSKYHSDPTGMTAARNVDRERGGKR